jgi:hypothetical protein
MAVEDIVFKKGDGSKLAPPAGFNSQKLWTACNFSFTLQGFEPQCKRIAKIDSFTVKQNIIEHHTGGRRTPIKTPSPIDFPQLTFYLPEADSDLFAQAAMDRIVKGSVKGAVPGRLHGSLTTFDNERRTLFTLTFDGADIVSVTPDRSDSSSEEIKMVKVEIFTEKMAFEYSGLDVA